MKPKQIFMAMLALLPVSCAPPDHTKSLDALRRKLPYYTKIAGRSMFPTLRDGSWYRVDEEAFAELSPGDVAAFWPDGEDKPVAHVLVDKVALDAWRTMGINNDGRLDKFHCTTKNYIGVIKP